jgi:hypothetical protein
MPSSRRSVTTVSGWADDPFVFSERSIDMLIDPPITQSDSVIRDIDAVRRRGYLECVEDCGHGVVDAGEHDDVHDPVGAEQLFCFAVECIVETMLDRQGTRDAMGGRFIIAEIPRKPALGEDMHLVSGESPMWRPTAQWAYSS